MNIEVMAETRKQVHQVLGALTLIDQDHLSTDNKLFLNVAMAELVGTVQGLSFIIEAQTQNPPEKEISDEAFQARTSS